MNSDELWSKARQAASSARLLLNVGDPAGACNRAYYDAQTAVEQAEKFIAALKPSST